MKNGVPYEEAITWSWARRTAWVVALGEMSGQDFDWDTGEWRARN